MAATIIDVATGIRMRLPLKDRSNAKILRYHQAPSATPLGHGGTGLGHRRWRGIEPQCLEAKKSLSDVDLDLAADGSRADNIKQIQLL